MDSFSSPSNNFLPFFRFFFFLAVLQREVAKKFFAAEMEARRLKKMATELEEVREFYDAEEEHQQVNKLRKGGMSYCRH